MGVDYFDPAVFNKLADTLAEECYVKTGSPHTDHFAYWKFAELLVAPLLNEIMQLRERNSELDESLVLARHELSAFRTEWPFITR